MLRRGVALPLLVLLAPTMVFAAEAPDDQERLLPRVDVYLPDGEMDLVLSRWLRDAFFEGQVRYDFVDGDITAFLRYRYYGEKSVWRLAFFDEVEFEQVQKFDSAFERTRGVLLLAQWPIDHHRRTFLLLELDDLSSNKPEQAFTTDRTNTFVRTGFQLGTPDDPRSNAIVGERRGRVESLFSAHRKIGPGGFGLTGAATWGFDFLGGDFDYAKVEFEGLKRFSVGSSSLIWRVSGGTFLRKVEIRPDIESEFEGDRYAIPADELLRLDGRENLKGIDGREVGTDEIHTTLELFMPWFQDQPRRAIGLDWDTWFWVAYAGWGAAGFDRDIYTDFGEWIPDVGLGIEASFEVKGYKVFLGAVVAKSLDGEGDPKLRVSLKSYR
jgi:hypothetical protein